MPADRTVSVKLQAKVDQFVSGMKKAEAATKQVKGESEKFRKESILMSKAAGAVGVAVAAAFAGKAIKAASDLNETLAKTSVVFGENADEVKAWAKTSSQSFGLSENAAASAAATYGNLFVSLGIASDESTEMSKRLVELAGDLASFNNVDPTEALDALRSGLVGETEPLKRFGVNMNEATLKAQAMKMGLIDTTKQALDPATKAAAAYALILEQTKTAQGDFARTSDGMANQMRILNAEWENAQAGLGQALLPVATEAVGVLVAMLEAFNKLPAPVKSTTVVVGLLGAAFLTLAPRIVATKVAMAELGVTSLLASGRLKSTAKAAGIAAVALAAASVATQKISEATQEAVPNTDLLVKALMDLSVGGSGALTSTTDGVVSFADALERVARPDNWDQLENGFFNTLGLIGVSNPELDAMTLYVENIDAALAHLVSTGNADAAAKSFGLMAAQAQAQGLSIDDVKGSLPQYAAALDSSSTAADDAAASAAAVAEEVVSLNDALAAMRGDKQSTDSAIASMEAAFDDAKEAVKGLTGATKKNRTELDLNSASGRKAQGALAGISDALFATVEAYGANGGSADEAAAATERARKKFIATAVAAGLTEDAAADLADQYGLVPSEVKTTFKTTGADKAAKDADKVNDAVRRIPGVKNVKIQVTTTGDSIEGTGGGRRVYASGGYVRGPGSGTSDSISARLSNGEYVVSARAVSQYGKGMLDAINTRRYADGGLVTTGSIGGASTGGFSVGGSGVPIVINLDGARVYESLLRLKRSRGGASLGLS